MMAELERELEKDEQVKDKGNNTGACALIWVEDASRWTSTLKTADSVYTLELTYALKLFAFIHICKQISKARLVWKQREK